jgi:hypothetical protein
MESHPLQAQNFNLGISGGGLVSFTTVRSSSKVQGNLPQQLNYYLSLNLFQDRFGIESGFTIATKGLNMRYDRKNYYVQMDAFTFPFLFILKSSLRSTPYIHVNYLTGITLENQYYIKSLDENVKSLAKKTFMIPNLSLGSRLSFRQGILGRIELGMVFNYALMNQYDFALTLDETNIIQEIKPSVHALRFQLIYFFLNSILK